MRAERLHLDWEGLRNTPFSHPILLLLGNKNAVILVGVRRDGPEEVAVSDPVFRDGEPFFLTREDLERAWGGAALVVTPLPPTKADTAFGFSWTPDPVAAAARCGNQRREEDFRFSIKLRSPRFPCAQS